MKYSVAPLMMLLLMAFSGMAQDPSRLEKEIKAFEQFDRSNPPKKKTILFIGSSTIRRWENMSSYFPEKKVINRGFGGSHTSDAVYFAGRIMGAHKPKQIFIYEGENDIASGKSVDVVFADLVELAGILKQQFAKATILFISVKPSPGRWKYSQSFIELNQKLAAYASSTKNIEFVDVYTPMLNEHGRPEPKYFVADSVHMTPLGYQTWTAVIKPHLK